MVDVVRVWYQDLLGEKFSIYNLQPVSKGDQESGEDESDLVIASQQQQAQVQDNEWAFQQYWERLQASNAMYIADQVF